MRKFFLYKKFGAHFHPLLFLAWPLVLTISRNEGDNVKQASITILKLDKIQIYFIFTFILFSLYLHLNFYLCWLFLHCCLSIKWNVKGVNRVYYHKWSIIWHDIPKQIYTYYEQRYPLVLQVLEDYISWLIKRLGFNKDLWMFIWEIFLLLKVCVALFSSVL